MRAMKDENLLKIADYINQYVIESNGISPSLSEIMKYMGMVKSTAYRHILELEKRGIVIYSGKNTLKIKAQGEKKVFFSRIAILGIIPCGEPEDYREEIQGYVAIPTEWIDGKCYLLRASGNSMVDIGIEDGDLVLIKITSDVCHRQVVVAFTENGTTLKRYMKEDGGRAWLLAENNTYSMNKRYLYPKYIKILGVALKIIKDVK